MEQRVSFITLGTADLQRSKAFYEALGWTASKYAEGKGVVFFPIGCQVLALYPRADLARDAGLEDASTDGFGGVSLSYNARSREEVDQVLAAFEAAGAKVTRRAYEVFWGGYLGYCADLDGHLWEIVFNPDAQIAPDGSVRLPG